MATSEVSFKQIAVAAWGAQEAECRLYGLDGGGRVHKWDQNLRQWVPMSKTTTGKVAGS
jgi:hypothetical protein